MKHIKKIFIILIVLIAYAGLAFPVRGAEHTLTPSSWYAVVWNRATDTLHWVNHVGEQASIARPQLPNEAGYGVSLYIAPNGRYMVIHGMLNNGRDGLGFYDLQAGTFLQTHEAQQGEFIITTDKSPFTLNSQYVALGLRTETAWRVIAFDATTGHSVAELTSNNPNIPQGYIPAGHLPVISLYDVDEGLGQYRLHVRFLPNGPVQPDVQMIGFSWIPTLNMLQMDTIPADVHFYDVLGATGQIAYAVRDPLMPDSTSGIYRTMMGHFDAPTPLFNQSNALAYSPEWVAGGLMVAFPVAQQPYATMWHIMPAMGGQSIPFAPDYDYLYGTSDGFLIADVDAGHIKYSNTLQFEAFAPTVGNVVYSTNTSAFQVVYVTPMGAMFSLASVADYNPIVGVNGVGAVNVAPQNTPVPPVVVDIAPPNTPVPPVVGVNVVGGVNVAPPVQPTATPINNRQVAPPVQPTNPPRAGIADGDCSMAVSQLISVDMVAHVPNIGGTLALRTNVTDEFPSHQVPSNSYVNVVGGPVCHKGHRMWRINVPLGGQIVVGYVSEGVNNMRYLTTP